MAGMDLLALPGNFSFKIGLDAGGRKATELMDIQLTTVWAIAERNFCLLRERNETIPVVCIHFILLSKGGRLVSAY